MEFWVPHPALAVVSIGRVNQQTEDLFLSVSPSPCVTLPFRETKMSLEEDSVTHSIIFSSGKEEKWKKKRLSFLLFPST